MNNWLLHRYGPYVGFIGGQTPMYRRVPKVGFTNPYYLIVLLRDSNSKPLDPLRLDKLQKWIDDGRIDPNHVITMKNLVDSGLMSNIKYGVKIVAHVFSEYHMYNIQGQKDFHSKIRIDVTRASEAAIEVVEKLGGQVICSHYNRLALRLLLKPQKFVPPYPLRARPPPRLMEYYTSDEHRGYLSPSYSLVYQEFLKDMHATGNVVSPNGNGRIEQFCLFEILFYVWITWSTMIVEPYSFVVQRKT